MHLITIYKWQQNVYLSHDSPAELIDSVKELYVKVLAYEATLLVHIHQNPPKRWARDVLKAGDWSDRIKSIQKLDVRCRQLTDVIAARRSQQWEQEERHWQNDLLRQPREDRQKHNIRTLYSNYEAYKNVNPHPVKGTCKWLLDHTDFLAWRESQTSSIIWVTADPGCGKSVLSKHLIDRKGEILTANVKSPTICYFFFKDGDEGRVDGAQAMCALLHQLFLQQPILYKYAEESFEHKGEKFLADFDALWSIFTKAATDESNGEVICLFDALDECREQSRKAIIAKLVDLYQHVKSKPNQLPMLKFLVTSRPYSNIERAFKELTDEFPQVRLAGEDESESISHEIDLVIEAKVKEIGKRLDLEQSTQSFLLARLLKIGHRTYLWLHLIFQELESQIETTRDQLEATIEEIPETVELAYTAILNKIKVGDRAKAAKLLHIVLGAARPLRIEEINEAMAVKEGCCSYEDLQLWQAEKCKPTVTHLCGLFLRVIDSKVYLIHQTAREFLMYQDVEGEVAKILSPSLYLSGRWKQSFFPVESDVVLTKICVWYLQLKEFEGFKAPNDKRRFTDYKNDPQVAMYRDKYSFIDYAANHWTTHFSPAVVLNDPSIVNIVAAKTYNTRSQAFHLWLCLAEQIFYSITPFARELQEWTGLMAASYFGHEVVVERLLGQANQQVSFESQNGGNALSLAAGQGHEAVVRVLLKQDNEIKRHMNTALPEATVNGHIAIVQLLLEAGAGIEFRDGHGNYLLHIAASCDSEAIVQLLLEAGAEVDSKNLKDQTPLQIAAQNGHETIIITLLQAGADVNSEDMFGRTSLYPASYYCRSEIVEILLESGAKNKINSNSEWGTALHAAARNDCEILIQSLLEAGAKIEPRDKEGKTPLHIAANEGREAVIKILLEAGAEVDPKDIWENTPLHKAAFHGREAAIKALLESGAEINARDNRGQIPLHLAIYTRNEAVIELLLNSGAEFDLKDGFGETPLHIAVKFDEEAMIRSLLKAGSRVHTRDCSGRTPLWRAVSTGHKNVIKVLLEAGADVHSIDDKGKVLIQEAPVFASESVVRLLLQAATFR